jgi:DNA-binding transcriptional regulator YdaS (Cro superfamily)
MADKSLRTKALQVALRVVGSERALSRRLQVPAADLSRWLHGEGNPPQSTFLRTVDLLVEHSSVDQLVDDELNPTVKDPGRSRR